MLSAGSAARTPLGVRPAMRLFRVSAPYQHAVPIHLAYAVQRNRDEIAFLIESAKSRRVACIEAHISDWDTLQLRSHAIDERNLELACEVRIPADLAQKVVDGLHADSIGARRWASQSETSYAGGS